MLVLLQALLLFLCLFLPFPCVCLVALVFDKSKPFALEGASMLIERGGLQGEVSKREGFGHG